MKYLQSLFLNGLTVRLQAPQTQDGGEGSGGFNPTEVQQSEGIFKTPAEMREEAEAQQKSEEDTGSLTTDAEVNSADSAEEAEETEGEESSSEATYTYGGVEVEVVNKPEMVSLFADKGIDLEKVNRELFSEEGLTGATKAVLDEAFGKASVDMYLEGWKTKNDAFIESNNAKTETANLQQAKILTDIAGDKSDDVFAWANDNLSEDEYKEYAELINSGNPTMMKVAFRELHNRSCVSAQLQQPEVKMSARQTAFTPDTTAPTQVSKGLSNADYLKLFNPGPKGEAAEYWKDPKGYDALREVGRDNGL